MKENNKNNNISIVVIVIGNKTRGAGYKNTTSSITVAEPASSMNINTSPSIIIKNFFVKPEGNRLLSFSSFQQQSLHCCCFCRRRPHDDKRIFHFIRFTQNLIYSSTYISPKHSSPVLPEKSTVLNSYNGVRIATMLCYSSENFN